MTLQEVMNELAALGSEQTKKTHLRHGAVEPLFGVRVGDLKSLRTRLKGNQSLALELYRTKNSDAMYLAGLIADGSKMSVKELNAWASNATWHMIADYTVPWVASEHPRAIPLSLKWIDAKKSLVAVAGWSTLSCVVTTVSDENLPIKQLADMLGRVVSEIHSSPDRLRYAMNGYVVRVGTYVAPLCKEAISTAKRIGKVEIDRGDTSWQVPDAVSAIRKNRSGAIVAPKRKTCRC